MQVLSFRRWPESALSRCFPLRQYRIKLTNNPLSHCAFPACYAHFALRSGSHFVGGDSDQQFTAAVAHSRGALRTRARADGGARVLGHVAPHAVCHHGSSGRARRCAFSLQRQAGHADLRAGAGIRPDARSRLHSSPSQTCARADRGARSDRSQLFDVLGLPEFQRQRRAGTVQVPRSAESWRAARRSRRSRAAVRATRSTKTANSTRSNCSAATSRWPCRITR